MKKIVALVLALNVLIGVAHAVPSCPDALGVTFPPNQKVKLCTYFLNTASLTGSLTFAGAGPIIAPTALGFAVGAATTPNYTLDNVKLLMPNTGVLAAPTAISLAVGAANTPNVTFNLSGMRLATAGMGVSMKPYVPTMAATPVAGTNDFKLGLNSVPTAAANTVGCLPVSPVDGDIVVVDNSMANAVRVKACSTPGVNGGAAGTYASVAAWQRAILKYDAALVTWMASLDTVPTPAGP